MPLSRALPEEDFLWDYLYYTPYLLIEEGNPHSISALFDESDMVLFYVFLGPSIELTILVVYSTFSPYGDRLLAVVTVEDYHRDVVVSLQVPDLHASAVGLDKDPSLVIGEIDGYSMLPSSNINCRKGRHSHPFHEWLDL